MRRPSSVRTSHSCRRGKTFRKRDLGGDLTSQAMTGALRHSSAPPVAKRPRGRPGPSVSGTSVPSWLHDPRGSIPRRDAPAFATLCSIAYKLVRCVTGKHRLVMADSKQSAKNRPRRHSNLCCILCHSLAVAHSEVTIRKATDEAAFFGENEPQLSQRQTLPKKGSGW